MVSFVCPHCKCESKIFPAFSGGADNLCKEFKMDLLGRIPI